MKKRSTYFLAIGFIILIAIASSFTSIISFVTDYKWFSELGYTGTFLTKLTTQIKVGVPVFLIVFLLLMIYLISIKRNYYKISYIIPDKAGERRLNVLLGLVSALISFFISTVFAGNLWFNILKFRNSTTFDIVDPIFQRDLSFYMFKLPLISEIMNLLLLLSFILAVVTIAFYLVMVTIRRPATAESNVFDFDDLANKKDKYGVLGKKILKTAIIQIGIIGLAVFTIIGVNYILRSYNLLYSARGRVFGAGYTDIKVSLQVYRVMAVVSILTGIGFLVGLIKKKPKLMIIGPVALVVLSIGGTIFSGAIQKFIVEPDEISKEIKYLGYNIDFTQKAYGLDRISEREFNVDNNLTREDLTANADTIRNIRINDYRPVEQVYNQIQGIRPYYRFKDIDIDRYYIDGQYTQVFLSPREFDQRRLSDQAQNWINQHLKYTHGYGVSLSAVNEVTSEGLPRLLMRDIPPVSTTDLQITRPEIYFGELTNDYIIVNTDELEFDYPSGSENVETIYQGAAGIELRGLNKLLFAIKEGNLKILISGNINSDSRIVINRNINERIRKIAPFIEYDDDPYIVINQEDGKLYWIIDGYTVSSRYPYSQPYGNTNVNYIRNSVKVVIDAYNGTTNYYVFDDTDPVIATYRKIFPDLFLDKEDMPTGLQAHVRYPQLMFDIQSDIYRTYHMSNPRVFFSREDLWDIAKEKYMMGQVQTAESQYLMFKLPEEDTVEFLLTVPYTPTNRNNMISLLVARNDGDNYGELILYRLPKSENIQGPMMIESRIDQDSVISPQLTLWSQEGSRVLRGNLLVIPIENSLLYVEPIYLQADNENSLPEAKRVIVAFRDRIVMEETLDLALEQLFGREIPRELEDTPIEERDRVVVDGDVGALVRKANEVFNRAKEASQRGDWASYGEHIKELEDILNQLNQSPEEENIEE